jgi:two-component system cell cycle response regulator DivK
MQTILLIDDNDYHHKFLRYFFDTLGYELLWTDRAEQGLALAYEAQPALILMDWRLPGMDGLAATRLLKQDPQLQAVPVIILTAQAMEGDREIALAAGCDGYITKPFDLYEFKSYIQQFLHPHG